MKLHIDMKLDNAAYDDEFTRPNAIIEDISKALASVYLDREDRYPIQDINGNTVGYIVTMED